MDKKQRIFLYITAAVTVLVTAAAVFAGMFCHMRSLAKHELKSETEQLLAENDALKTRMGFLQSDVSSKSDNTDQKNRLNKNITDTTEKLSELKSELNLAKGELSALKAKNEALSAEYNALKRGMNPVKGAYKNADNARLMCPASISAGRYTASGSGTVTVTAVTGAARISENLSEIDTNSYTFDIESGEDIETHGEVTITELK